MTKLSFRLLLIALAAFVLTPSARAEEVPQVQQPGGAQEVTLHSLFQTNMVLQRDKPVSIWGWAPANTEVTVSFGGQKQTTKAGPDQSWKVALAAMPANSNPQQMVVQARGKTITLENILIGDIWVMGGQSNMQHPLSNCENGAVEIACANFPNIRLLTVPAIISHTEKKNFPRRQLKDNKEKEEKKDKQPDGDWDVCSPKTVPDFSGIGYAFVRRVHMASGVPIGAIDASYWGTTLESWTPLSVLESMDSEVVRAQFAEWKKKAAGFDPQKDLADRVKRYYQLRTEDKSKEDKPPTDLRGGPADDQNHPGNCYASVIAPLAGFAVKGAIWHQGFNNSRADADRFYYQVFPKMIASWRAAFNDPQMAFGIISLCTDTAPQTLDNYLECMTDYGIFVREAQYKVFLDMFKAGDKNIGFASSFDFRRAWYHPQEKIPAGERIARWAMATQYKIPNIPWLPPMVTKSETKDDTLLLHFNTEVNSVDSQAIAGFSIAGEDGKFQPAQAEPLVIGQDDKKNQPKRDQKILVLRSPYVAKPVHFRYAWGRNPMGNLRMASTHEKDCAFAAQRSDNWTMADMFQAYTGKKAAGPIEINGQELAELRKALQAADLARRIGDAKALLR